MSSYLWRRTPSWYLPPNATYLQLYARRMWLLLAAWRQHSRSRSHYRNRSSQALNTASGKSYIRSGTRIDQSRWSQIADIVAGTQDCGAKVSAGKLLITSVEHSRRPYKTALIASGMNTSLQECDSRSILELQDEHDRHGPETGLDEIIPLRHSETLERTGSWALIFTSPAYAEAFQRTILRLQAANEVRRRELDVTAINTSLGWTSLRLRGGTKPNSFVATTLLHHLTLEARLYPFDEQLYDAIQVQRELTRPRTIGKYFPVRLCVSDLGYLSVSYIQKLLHADGVGRGRSWAVLDSDDAIIQVGREVASKVDRLPTHDNWRVDFLTRSDAAQFVRMWHRRPLPALYGVRGDMVLRAECLF